MENNRGIMDEPGKYANKFEDLSSNPSPGLWDKIAADLESKKKKRVLVWWWYPGIAALLVGVIGVWQYSSQRSLDVNKNQSTQSQLEQIELTDTTKSIDNSVFSNKGVNSLSLAKNIEEETSPSDLSKNENQENNVLSRIEQTESNSSFVNEFDKSNVSERDPFLDGTEKIKQYSSSTIEENESTDSQDNSRKGIRKEWPRRSYENHSSLKKNASFVSKKGKEVAKENLTWIDLIYPENQFDELKNQFLLEEKVVGGLLSVILPSKLKRRTLNFGITESFSFDSQDSKKVDSNDSNLSDTAIEWSTVDDYTITVPIDLTNASWIDLTVPPDVAESIVPSHKVSLKNKIELELLWENENHKRFNTHFGLELLIAKLSSKSYVTNYTRDTPIISGVNYVLNYSPEVELLASNIHHSIVPYLVFGVGYQLMANSKRMGLEWQGRVGAGVHYLSNAKEIETNQFDYGYTMMSGLMIDYRINTELSVYVSPRLISRSFPEEIVKLNIPGIGGQLQMGLKYHL